MNIPSIFLFFVLIISACANPIMDDEGAEAEKLSESCLIFVNQESLRVSCQIEYKIIDRSSPDIRVHVPVYCTVPQYQELDKTKKFIDARIECEGLSYSPRGVFSSDVDEKGFPFLEEVTPNTKVKVNCEFLIKTPNSDKFTILVTYSQPLIGGVAYYLPLFEAGSPANMTDFEIAFFTTSGLKLNLVTQHPNRSKIMSRRVSVIPKQGELIAVKIDNDKTVEKTPEK